MQIAERTIGDVTILDLNGRLVAGDGDDELRDAVDRLAKIGCRKLLLNLTEVPYIDSGGLGVLVSKYCTLRRRDGHLKLCNLTPRAARVLEITKLLTVFGAFPSEAEGVKSFTGPAEA
jgi:anti-sigma B factor antagonist